MNRTTTPGWRWRERSSRVERLAFPSDPYPVPIMKRSSIITIVFIVAFGALLLFNTLSAQKHECTVCVEFNGKRNCATASNETEAEAERAAQTTACGTLASGMDQSIACDRTPPISRQCKTR